MKRLALSLGVAVLAVFAMPVLSRAGTLTYTFQTVDFPGDRFTQLLETNNSGTIAGYHGAVINESFTLTLPNSFVLEDASLSTNTQVIGINDKDQLVGFYLDASGNTDGFVPTPTATVEPASLLLIGTGLLAITLMVRKRRKGVK
jgi:hypothetical protein